MMRSYQQHECEACRHHTTLHMRLQNISWTTVKCNLTNWNACGICTRFEKIASGPAPADAGPLVAAGLGATV